MKVNHDFRSIGGAQSCTLYERLTKPGVTQWLRVDRGFVAAQVSGTATDVVVVVERSPLDPKGCTCVSPADPDGLTGDLTKGVSAKLYQEPTVGWWRVNVKTLTGGVCEVALSGEGVE